MTDITKLANQIEQGLHDSLFRELYGESLPAAVHRERYHALLARFRNLFPEFSEREILIFSTPGRTELGGNHTDHNRGKVLAASVNLDTLAAVVPTEEPVAVIDSEGFDQVAVDLTPFLADELPEPDPAHYNSTESLVMGIAEKFRQTGCTVGGFKACTISNVLKGSGLSSSAAIEITIASIFNELYNDGTFDPVTLAKFSQYAENRWFGKPSGLMDQTACAYGGIIEIDFKDAAEPTVNPVTFNFHDHGYTLAVVDTAGSHANLTPAYASIPEEMGLIAAHFGYSHCRDLSMDQLTEAAAELRKAYGDRAFLRAFHFFKETHRAGAMAEALTEANLADYLVLVRESGRSSSAYLQNLYPNYEPAEQGLNVAIALSEEFLQGEGACRVHGGGFAGTIQVYIPNARFQEYIAFMEPVFGKGSVIQLAVRQRKAGIIL